MSTRGRPLINLYINWLLAVLCFSIPLYRQWVSVLAPLITVLWLFEGDLRARLELLRKHPLTVAVVGFIALNLLSLLWSAHPVDGSDYVAKYRYLLLIPVIATSLRHRYLGTARRALYLGTGLSLGFSVCVFFGLLRFGAAHRGNPSPTMSHLDYSMVLAVVGVLVFHHLASEPMTARRRAMLFALLLLIAGGLVINIGRSGQVAFFGTLLVLAPFYASSRQTRRITLGAVGAVLVTLAVAYLLLPGFTGRVNATASGLYRAVTDQRYDTSIGQRVAGSITGLAVVRQHPLLGTGVGDNMVEFRRLLDTHHRDLRQAVYWFPHMHNQYLQVATELGLLGVGALLYLMYRLIRGPYASSQERGAAIAAGVAYLIGFMGDPYLHKQLPLVLFGVIGGMLSANGRSPWWNQEGTGPEDAQ